MLIVVLLLVQIGLSWSVPMPMQHSSSRTSDSPDTVLSPNSIPTSTFLPLNPLMDTKDSHASDEILISGANDMNNLKVNVPPKQ